MKKSVDEKVIYENYFEETVTKARVTASASGDMQKMGFISQALKISVISSKPVARSCNL